jgi:hypothetical protein
MFDYSNSDVYTHTVEGRMYLRAPKFTIPAMARALSNTARFGGNTYWRYSVAQHCVLVSELMEYMQIGDPMEGLLHDGVEHVIQDIPSPYKHMEQLNGYRSVEQWLDFHLRKQFDLPTQPTPEMKWADSVALFIEAWYLIPERGRELTFAPGHDLAKSEADNLINGGWRPYYMHERTAERMFIERYDELVEYDTEDRPPLTFEVNTDRLSKEEA